MKLNTGYSDYSADDLVHLGEKACPFEFDRLVGITSTPFGFFVLNAARGSVRSP